MKTFSLKYSVLFLLLPLIFSCTKEEEVDPFTKDSGVFIDQRDQTEYSWIKIGQLIWMADNLAYEGGNRSMVYDDDETYAATYGRLYTWVNALSACPSGWHLPSDQEWELLALYVSIKKGPFNQGGDDWLVLGGHLKAASGWGESKYNGTDDFGFAGLPGGLSDGSEFGYKGEFGGWWSSTEESSTRTWIRGLMGVEPDFYRYKYPKVYAFSVRCVKD